MRPRERKKGRVTSAERRKRKAEGQRRQARLARLKWTITHMLAHTYTHTRCSLLLLLGKVGRGPSLWLQKTLWNWRQDAGGGLNLPVPWRRWRSCRALGEEGAAGTPQSPSAARGTAAAGRGKCCSGLALKVSCPGLTPRWPEGSPCPVY